MRAKISARDFGMLSTSSIRGSFGSKSFAKNDFCDAFGGLFNIGGGLDVIVGLEMVVVVVLMYFVNVM